MTDVNGTAIGTSDTAGSGPGTAPQDLDSVLASLDAKIEGRYVFTTGDKMPEGTKVFACIHETAATTWVIDVADASRLGIPTDECYTHISVGANTALNSVGVTAALTQTLATREIPCNVIAGFYQDHLFVPETKAGEAKAILKALSKQARGWMP